MSVLVNYAVRFSWRDGEGEVVDGADGELGSGGDGWGIGGEGGLPYLAADFDLACGDRRYGRGNLAS